jgi:hypothetical protein
MSIRPTSTAEFGDFQTPSELARSVCQLLAADGLRPAALLEPTCGTGNFLFAALDAFSSIGRAVGLDINPAYVDELAGVLRRRTDANKVNIVEGNFFDTDWTGVLRDLPDPLLVIGNPPWVTNSHLGVLGSNNLPQKTNFQHFTGFDALTGKSNFDISEWMMLRVVDWLDGRDAEMALLCKTAVARKVLSYVWKRNVSLSSSAIYSVDAHEHFGCSVDACLLVCRFSPGSRNPNCMVYADLQREELERVIGYRDGQLVADVCSYDGLKHLGGGGLYKWRSGIKHDCAKVMELQREGTFYRNGLGELIDLEDRYVYPMLKSSDLAREVRAPRYWMLVPQRSMDDDTSAIGVEAPKTWGYLRSHAERFDRRGSSIYRTRPQFAIFGVGEYSFAPWKVAISGFYKKLDFRVLGRFCGRPVVLDDTVNFIACYSEEEARFLASLLNSETAKAFFQAFLFWDAKRPVTVGLLNRLDLKALARETGTEDTFNRIVSSRDPATGGEAEERPTSGGQLRLALEC